MTESRPVEIVCSACGADALVVRKPKYEGFTKVGETLSCAACGHEYAREEDVPFKGRKVVKVFTDADRSADVKVFRQNEAGRLCRHCGHYLINPFTQWCHRHHLEVEATDTCGQFMPRPPPKEEKKDEKRPPI
jgi:hypothetical protein